MDRKTPPPAQVRRPLKLDRRTVIAATPPLALGALAALSGCADDRPPLAGSDGAIPGPDRGPGPDHGKPRPDGAAPRDGAPPDAPPGPDAAPPDPARVVEVLDKKSVTSGGKVVAARMDGVLRQGLLALSGAATVKAAWAALLPGFSPSQRIGIKVNCINASVASSPAFIAALVRSLTAHLGAKADRIVVWDRAMWELKACGFTSSSTVAGAKVVATDPGDGGPGHETTPRAVVAGRSVRLSKVLTSETDVTINCGVLKDHDIGGVTGALKNTYGCIDDPGKLHGMNPDLPALFALSPFKNRMKLFFIEAFIATARGGPMGPATHAPAKLLLSRDPVAIDAHELALINGLRGAGQAVDPNMLGWLAEAQKRGLGSTTPKLVKRTLA